MCSSLWDSHESDRKNGECPNLFRSMRVLDHSAAALRPQHGTITKNT